MSLNISIVQKDNPVLRQVARKVPLTGIKTEKIQTIIKQMSQALATQDDGVAIAAPQIGVPLRIFVVSKKVQVYNRGNEEISAEELNKLKDDVYINPEITRLSRQKLHLDEGCLSVRYLYGKVWRSEKASLIAYDENGRKIKKGASGLLAQIFQHETDHLNGILFIDKADNIINQPPNEK